MPNVGQAVLSGAELGLAAGGPLGLPAGLIGGAVGLFAGLFGGSDEEDERQNRRAELLKTLNRIKSRRRLDALKRVSGLVGGSRQAAMERAAALGRTSEQESFILPAEQGAIQAGNEYVNQSDLAFDQQEIGIESEFAQRPIGLNFSDYLSSAAKLGSSYFLNDQYFKILGQKYSPKPDGVAGPKPDGVAGIKPDGVAGIKPTTESAAAPAKITTTSGMETSIKKAYPVSDINGTDGLGESGYFDKFYDFDKHGYKNQFGFNRIPKTRNFMQPINY